MTCSRIRSQFGPMQLYAPEDMELKSLTDEELKHTIPCYCDRCGTELRIHPLFPQVGGNSLEHACVAKRPVYFRIENQKIEPMQAPISKIIDRDWQRQQWAEEKKALSEENFLDKAKALLEREKP